MLQKFLNGFGLCERKGIKAHCEHERTKCTVAKCAAGFNVETRAAQAREIDEERANEGKETRTSETENNARPDKKRQGRVAEGK